ncbi:MAG: hypothetical protein ABSE73_05675 [Planctomycetota bacterium]
MSIAYWEEVRARVHVSKCTAGVPPARGRPAGVSKCTAGVPPARGRPAGREDEGGRDARGTLWATHLLTCTLRARSRHLPC